MTPSGLPRFALVAVTATTLAACGIPVSIDPPANAPMGDMPMGHGGGGGDAPPVDDTAETVRVEAGDLYFSPDRLEVRAGETVNIEVTNVGDAFHDFTVRAADFMLDVDPGATAAGALVLDEPGEYEFLCTVPGHAAAGMTGTITVSG